MSLLLNVITLIFVILGLRKIVEASLSNEIKNYIKKVDHEFREVIERLQDSEWKYRNQIITTLLQINKTNPILGLKTRSFAFKLKRKFLVFFEKLKEFHNSKPFALNDTEGIDPKTSCFKGNDSIKEYEETMAIFLNLTTVLKTNQTDLQKLFNESLKMFHKDSKKLNAEQKNLTISSFIEINKTISQNLIFQLDAKQSAYNISNILISFKLKLIEYCVQKEALTGLFAIETNASKINTRKSTRQTTRKGIRNKSKTDKIKKKLLMAVNKEKIQE
ncbi:hypothetical protein PVAND_012812 [Polypedilum vanderplanki]|uniref:Uncharacterized protein n=1 Tax=Polypedilum vanderplanki TaxID=319348 RepID=A0A9J6CML8_POLVA|nr:hypothetical protein PVAND_012812 [Polypedilum vanderplanki]